MDYQRLKGERIGKVLDASVDILYNEGLWRNAYLRMQRCLVSSECVYHDGRGLPLRRSLCETMNIYVYEALPWHSCLLSIQQPNLYRAFDRLEALANENRYHLELISESEAELRFS